MVQPIKQRPPHIIQRDVLYALTLRELQTRVARNRVGFLWTLIEPLAHLAVPVVLFGFIFNRQVPGFDYPVFLLYGLMPYLLFKSICMQTMEGASANRGILSYRQVHLIDVILARAMASAFMEFTLLSVIFLGLALMGYDVLPTHPIELAGTLLIVASLALGLGMILAAIASTVPDLRPVIRILFMPLYLISGVLYPLSRIPSEWLDWFTWNPMLHLIDLCRYWSLEGYATVADTSTAFAALIAASCLFVGLSLYRLRRLSRVTP